MGIFDIFRRRKPVRDEASFTELALELCRVFERVERAERHPDPDVFAIQVWQRGDDEPHTTYLNNIWRALKDAGAKAQRDELTDFLAKLVNVPKPPKTWAKAQALVFPALRSAAYVNQFQYHAEYGASAPLWRPALPGLVQLLAIDLGETVTMANASSLEEWGVSADEAWAQAYQNLARLTPQAGEVDGAAGLVRIASGQIDAASYLLCPGFLARFAAAGDHAIAWCADRDWLTVLRSDDLDDGTLGKLAEMAQSEFEDAARQLSPCLYTVDSAGTVIPLAVPPEHADHAALHKGEVILAAMEYEQQKAALDERNEREEIDVFVASLLAYQQEDGSLMTVATWADACESLLPNADFVAFIGDDDTAFQVSFASVLREIPSLRPDPAYWPTRYHVTSWPDAATLERLRAEAE